MDVPQVPLVCLLVFDRDRLIWYMNFYFSGFGFRFFTQHSEIPNQLEGYTMNTVRAYEEVIEFIATGTSPGSIIAFRPSEAVKERVADLIHREKTTILSLDEKSELDHYMQLEHLMRLAKARARQYISNE